MGEAADDLWDSVMRNQNEWDAFMDSIRAECSFRMLGRIPCVMIQTPIPYHDEWDSENYLPLTCMHCGKQFDREY